MREAKEMVFGTVIVINIVIQKNHIQGDTLTLLLCFRYLRPLYLSNDFNSGYHD